ncbi:MAG: hypothetical protein KDH88_04580 [Chromatiales bacterium]|nr:hypothetical protein [Chromatiales bacterium]
MSDSSRKPLRCLAALLLFLVIGILAYLAVVEPLQRQSLDLDTDIERITGQIDRYQGLLRTQAELSRAVEVLKTTHEQDLYFSDKSPTQVATELQGLLRSVASDAGTNLLRSSERIVEDTEGSPTLIVVDATLSATVNQLRAMLDRLQRNRPMLFVVQLAIDARPIRKTKTGVELNPELNVALGLAAYHDAQHE